MCSRTVRHFPPVRLFVVGALVVALGASGCETTSDVAPPRDDNDDETEDVGVDTTDAEEDVDAGPPGPSEIEVIPQQVLFEGVETDATESEEIYIWSRGEGPLEVQGVEFRDFPEGVAEDFAIGGDLGEFPISIDPEEALDFPLEYSPSEPGAVSGELVITSDDEDQPEATVRIETISAYPEIEAPSRINFGTVDPEGDPKTEQLAVYNRGTATLEIDTVEIDPESTHPDVFSVSVDGPTSLDRNSFVHLDVTFEPDVEDSRRARLDISTNDPVDGEHVVELRGNSPTPCIQTSGDVEFQDMSQGEEQTQTVSLFNCSMTNDLEIDNIEIADDAGGVFELVDPPDQPVELGPTDIQELDVQATMEAEQESVGMLSMETDDPDAETVELELRAIPPSED